MLNHEGGERGSGPFAAEALAEAQAPYFVATAVPVVKKDTINGRSPEGKGIEDIGIWNSHQSTKSPLESSIFIYTGDVCFGYWCKARLFMYGSTHY